MNEHQRSFQCKNMIYKATFYHSAGNGLDYPEVVENLEFLVEAGSIEEAKGIAKSYEMLEIYANEYVCGLKEIKEASDKERHSLSHLNVYEDYLKSSKRNPSQDLR